MKSLNIHPIIKLPCLLLEIFLSPICFILHVYNLSALSEVCAGDPRRTTWLWPPASPVGHKSDAVGNETGGNCEKICFGGEKVLSNDEKQEVGESQKKRVSQETEKEAEQTSASNVTPKRNSRDFFDKKA